MNECSKNTAVPPEVKKLLASCTNLPSLPSVVINIIEASKDPDIGLADIAEIVHVDPALSAKLMGISNSPLYARRRKISNLRDALSLLGLDAALTIALSFSLVKTLSNSVDSKINYDKFWKRSILSATIARQIGEELKLPNLEDFFLASLLQDIGILVIDSSSLHCQENDTTSSHTKRITCEQETLGIDHSDVGAWLLKSWNLPEKLYRAVLCSHTAYSKPAETYEEEIFYQCIGLSGNMANIWSEEDPAETIESNFESAHNLLGFNREEFNNFINNISNLLPEISSLFEIKLVDQKKRDEVINEARNILMDRNLNLIKQINEDRTEIDALTARTKNIEEEANRDHLTGVYNRKYIEKILNIEFNNSSSNHQPLSLAFIDLDNFKVINDTNGHLAGDMVLQELANFFSKGIRITDTLARYGGDEFLLMLPNTESDIALNLLKRLNKELQSSPGTEFNTELLKISISIGVATYTNKSGFSKLIELISAADKALYNAKKSGKNTIVSY